jgi:hypothetical protein
VRRLALAALACLAGCGSPAPVPKPTPTPARVAKQEPPRTILISYGACFGECPIFTVTVSETGQGKFEGQNFTALSGERGFSVTRGQFAAVAAALEPLRRIDPRPLTEQVSRLLPGDVCVTDSPSRIIVWTQANGREQALVRDLGCESARGVQPAIDKALAALPVAPWIKSAD